MADTNFETIIYTQKGKIAEIKLNRPDRLNAVVEKLYDEVLVALDVAERDCSVSVVVLTGEGRAFCVGADMKEHGKGERTDFDKRRYLIVANDVCEKIYKLKKPIIAAVNGYALGAGAEMSVSADFLLMKESAMIGFPEISIGTYTGGGISYLLPRLVGLVKARELVFTGEKINGKKAHDIGLATRYFADDEFEKGVMEFAELISSKAPVSMGMAKRNFNNSGSYGYDAMLEIELECIRGCMTTKDWREGVDAFTEKRSPNFTGK
ncbi:MAG: enoyl-CoA hydratase/isomerase family protein [Alphaproteobacteria bacterium]|nr:enoyl-CoA hydratase/isomerase family protein [Alphaproteobacteria bacterium]